MANGNRSIDVGDRVKDKVTGFSGIVVARTVWLNGCPRITVQPEKLTKEGASRPTETFDELQCELLKAGVVNAQQPVARSTGGPRDDKAALRR